MRYLVFPLAALDKSIRSSEHFPTIVDMSDCCDGEYKEEDIIGRVFGHGQFRPVRNKKYCIVPLHTDAKIVTFRPIPVPQYEVEVSRL